MKKCSIDSDLEPMMEAEVHPSSSVLTASALILKNDWARLREMKNDILALTQQILLSKDPKYMHDCAILIARIIESLKSLEE
ncbi:MAG: hypothetical protein Q8Q18_03680 [bacterium]|nr:hypothetical protein [bacterium]